MLRVVVFAGYMWHVEFFLQTYLLRINGRMLQFLDQTTTTIYRF